MDRQSIAVEYFHYFEKDQMAINENDIEYLCRHCALGGTCAQNRL